MKQAIFLFLLVSLVSCTGLNQSHKVYHNIIWGNIRTGVRLNRPGNYHQVYNNTTVSIDNRYGPWEGPAVQFGSSIVNNYSVRPIVANEEVFQANNAQGFPYDTLKLIPQVTEPSKGFDKYGFPDYIGAISNSSENWTLMAVLTGEVIGTGTMRIILLRNSGKNQA